MIIIGPSISLCHHPKMGCVSIFMWGRVDCNLPAPLKSSITGRVMQTGSTGADKSLAQPGRKQATVTEDSDVHISYLLT
jgi:hypothetical protein